MTGGRLIDPAMGLDAIDDVLMLVDRIVKMDR